MENEVQFCRGHNLLSASERESEFRRMYTEGEPTELILRAIGFPSKGAMRTAAHRRGIRRPKRRGRRK